MGRKKHLLIGGLKDLLKIIFNCKLDLKCEYEWVNVCLSVYVAVQ